MRQPREHSSGLVTTDPANVSCLVHGAEMRAVNRALRKAYGIGICSVEEIGSLSELPQLSGEPKKVSPHLLMGTARVVQSVIVSARLFASIN